MKSLTTIRKYITLGLGISTLAMGSSMANAAIQDLCVGQTTLTMPDGASVVMWGYAPGGATAAGQCLNAVQIPGPAITVTAADPTLTINLTNTLSVPTSVIIPSQALPTDVVPAALVTPTIIGGRMRSLVHEAPAAGAAPGTATYVWSSIKPGSHIYHSGTHQQVQVQMGLYGAMVMDTAANTLYPGITYSTDVTLFYSDVDPVLHASIAADCFGTAPVGGACDATLRITSTRQYDPKYFLVNGMPSNGIPEIAAGNANSNILVRFFNAGLQTYIPQSLGMDLSLVAENGYVYPFPKRQYSVDLHALKTVDAIFNTPTTGTYTIYDRRMNVSDGTTATGFISRLVIGSILAKPIAVADTIIVDEDALAPAATINLCANDTATLPETIVGSSVSPSPSTTGMTDITFDVADPTACIFTYTPNANFNGSEQLTYTVADSAGTVSDPTTISITVNPVNDIPVAVADAISVIGGSIDNVFPASTFLVNDSDIDVGDILTITAVADTVTPPTLGIVSLVGSTIVYTPPAIPLPPAVPATSDTFTYTITDSGGLTATATVTVTITDVPPPVANADTVTTNEDTTIIIPIANLLLNDTADTTVDPTNAIDPLSLLIDTDVANGLVPLAVDVALGTITYTPALNFNGADQFTYTIADTTGSRSLPATVTINVTPVNDLPVAVNDAFNATGTINFVSTIPAPGVLAGDSDVDGDLLTAVPGPITSTLLANVVMNVSGSFTYQPTAALADGVVDTFVYTLSDGTATVTATVSITIVPASGPVVGDDAVTTDEDVPVTISVLLNDVPVAPAVSLQVDSVSIVSGPTNGSVVANANGTIDYSPTFNLNGVDTFTYTVLDNLNQPSAPATVTVTVTPVNDAPIGVADFYTTDPGVDLIVSAVNGVLANDSDPENDPITAGVLTPTTNGGTVSILGSDGSFSYTPPVGVVNGTDSFTYEASDGTLLSGPVTVTITIVSVTTNTPPKPEKDEIALSSLVGNIITPAMLLGNDVDAEDANLAAVGSVALFDPAFPNGAPTITTSNGGSVTLNGDGTLTYTRPADVILEVDSFQYLAIDSGGLQSTPAGVDILLLK